MMRQIPHNPKKIEMILLLCATHNATNYSTMSAFFKSIFSAVGMNEYTQLLGQRVFDYPKNICVLCLDPVEDRANSGCCAECDFYAELLISVKDFHTQAKRVIDDYFTTINQKNKNKTASLYMDENPNCVYVPDTSIFSNPEKHLYYACMLVSFWRTYNSFEADIATNECELYTAPSLQRRLVGVCGKELASVYTTNALTALKASYQVPEVKGKMSTFWMFEGGISGSFFTHTEGTDATKGIVFKVVSVSAKNCETGSVFGIFTLTEINSFNTIPNISNLLDDIPLYILSNDIKNKRAGRVIKYRNPHLDFDHPIDDPVWEKLHQERQEKLAKRTEQQRKEQERQERLQLKREEQRQLAIQQKEREQALRLARASLVEATAKVDVELEQLRKLKELNREVALTNKKIFERKEAEKLAKDAEKRHAEKLKQKEIERQQKFVSKKQ
jgi:hypothetical protein